jgi:hypothetical protein
MELASCLEQGAGKKRKSVTPWWVGGSEYEKGMGSELFFDILIVFLNSTHRETSKNVIKENREKNGFGFLVEFFVNTFRHDVFFFWRAKKNRIETFYPPRSALGAKSAAADGRAPFPSSSPCAP